MDDSFLSYSNQSIFHLPGPYYHRSMDLGCNISGFIFGRNQSGCGEESSSMSTSSPMTGTPEVVIPREVMFNDDSLFSVIAYSVLFLFAAVGNLTVFITLFRNRHRKSRVNLFIMNLSVADLIVTFVMMPLEIGWHATVGWVAGDTMCRIMMFWRAFGFYLSSFILITISLDRYFAINHPLSLSDADKRGKIMLAFAWCFSAIASIPQSVIFHVETHPAFSWFQQCVTFNFFPSPAHELAYNLFNLIALYAAPLIVIIIAYSLILCEINKRTKESKEQFRKPSRNGREPRKRKESIRRSGMGRIEKARIRTLKMTIVIVLVFVTCWTPYFVISAWWWIDKTSAIQIPPKLQRTLFLFAVSNSCVNPIVYGMFTNTFLRELKRCYNWICTGRRRLVRERVYRSRPQSSSAKLHQHLLMQQTMTPPRRPRTSNGPFSAPPPQCAAQDLMCTTCAIAISSDSENPVFHMRIHRTLTPPHIAEGKGHSHDFDKYILL